MIVDSDVRSLKIEMAARHEFFLLFKEILIEMVSRNQQGEFLVNIDLVKSRLCLKIHDTGVGEEPSVNKTAINNMKKRLSAIGGELDVEANKNGVAVVLLMPVRK